MKRNEKGAARKASPSKYQPHRITNRLIFKEISEIRRGMNRYFNRAEALAFDVSDFDDLDSSKPLSMWRSGIHRMLSEFEDKVATPSRQREGKRGLHGPV